MELTLKRSINSPGQRNLILKMLGATIQVHLYIQNLVEVSINLVLTTYRRYVILSLLWSYQRFNQ